MKALLWRLWHRGVRRLGVYGMVAIVLALPMLAGVTAWTSQLTRQTAELHAAAVLRKAALAAGVVVEPARAPTSNEQLTAFVATFPRLDQNAADLERIFGTAADHNIQLLKGEYQLKAEPNATFLAYTVTLPVRDRYGAIKDFIADVMKTLPHASLDELRVTRDDADTATLDAVVRFTLIYRSQ